MTAQPQDHQPAVADLPKTVTIATSAGAATVPHPTRIPSGILRKARKLDNEVDQLFYFVEELNDDKTIELLDQLEMVELADFFKQWMQGASLGESVSSES